jgi:hypothetical protein
MEFLQKIIPGSSDYLKIRNEYSWLSKDYQVPGESKFIGGMPVTLERDCLRPIIRKNKAGEYVYHVTLKVDGERLLMFINNESAVYFISRSMGIYSSGKKIDNLSNCLFDGEMTNKEYLLFDTLFFNGKSVMESNYYTRYSYLKNVIFDRVSIKKWFNLGEVLTFNDCYSEIKKRSNTKLNSDGLILQPFDTNYIPFGPWIKNENIQFKWKPIEDQTIDFKIKVVDNNTWSLITKNGNPFMISQKSGNPLPAICKPTRQDKNTLHDGDVAEFKLIGNNIFKVLRPRPNKEPNSIPAALSVINFLNNPFTLDTLKTENKLNLLSKSQLILCICKKFNTFFTESDLVVLNKYYDLISLDPSIEFEVRLYKSGNVSGGVKKYVFDNIYDYLKDKYPFGVIQTIDIIKDSTRSEYLPNGTYTGTITKKKYDIYSENKELLTLIKNTAKQFMIQPDVEDIKRLRNQSMFTEREYSSCYYRFGLSQETKVNGIVPEIEGSRSNLVRYKNRISYYIGSLWRIDLTVVKEGFSRRLALQSQDKYEIEIEYIGNKKEVILSFNDFIDSLTKVILELLISANNC